MVNAAFNANINTNDGAESLVELSFTGYGAKVGIEIGSLIAIEITEEVASSLVAGTVSAVFPLAGAIFLGLGAFKIVRIVVRGSQFVRQTS